MRVDLLPLGVRLEVERGASLEAVLAPLGVEFPCGGEGTCGGCRVRAIEGDLAVTPETIEALTAAEIDAGWRLACRCRVESNLKLEVAQWEMPVLADSGALPFEPAEGCAVAIDLGTTTLAVQLVDLATGEVVAVETALNPQAAYGSDVMTRVECALRGGAGQLMDAIRKRLGEMISHLPRGAEVRLVMLAGNTVMHHLFCGADVTPLAQAPFETTAGGERVFTPHEVGWNLPDEAVIRFLPCLGSFVGSDILAGILATGIAERDRLSALIDLGTNGEIVVGNGQGLLCASTAAGPAFEAGRIRMGMRAATGAIAHVAVVGQGSRPALLGNCGASSVGQAFLPATPAFQPPCLPAPEPHLECRVIGDVPPRGICGSGLVDAAAAGLELGAILPSGRLANRAREFPVSPPVAITQSDIRELQLAKGAVAAGLRILLERWGARAGDLETIHLAGAFGNYMNVASARRIGLMEADAASIEPSGNTSLRGVRMALLSAPKREARIAGVRALTQHVPLAADPRFQEIFAECMGFK